MTTPSLGTNLPTPIKHEMPALRVLVYGEPGVGKTQLALSFPKPLVVNTDGGLEGGAIEQLRARGGDGEEWLPEKWKDLNALYFWLKQQVEKRGYETIVIDSLSELCVLLLHEAMEAETKLRGEGSERERMISAELQDFGKVAYAVDLFLKDLKQLSLQKNVHIVLTGGVRKIDPEKNRYKRQVDAQDAVEGAAMYWANVGGELVIKEFKDGDKTEGNPPKPVMIEKRVLWTNPADRERRNKTRFAALYPGVIEPTFPKFQAEIEKRLQEQANTEPAQEAKK